MPPGISPWDNPHGYPPPDGSDSVRRCFSFLPNMLIFSILTTSPTPFLCYVTWFLLGFYIYLIYQPSSSQKGFHILPLFPQPCGKPCGNCAQLILSVFSTKHYVNFKVPPHSVSPEDSPVFFKDSAGFSPFSLDKRSCGC